ncbi:MAG: hypothetical protein D6773_11155, partial [Alphaproteobacteria bacterium]
MANALGIDLARVYTTAENVKSSRLNRLAQKKALGIDPNAERARLESARRNALSGDPAALTNLAAISPAEAMKVQQY